MSVDPELVAVRAAAAAIEPFRDETKRMELLWRVAKVLEVPKDLRPCCACDNAPCIHNGKPCDCWACEQLRAKGIADVDRAAEVKRHLAGLKLNREPSPHD